MEYVLLNVDFTGNDDANVVGFIAREVESQKEWKKQIKEAIKQELEDSDGVLELYNSDNCSTPFESLEEVLGTFSMKKITKEDFLVLSNLFGSSKNVVSYGNTENFLDYDPPAPKAIKEKIIPIHGKVVEEIKLYCSEGTSDKVYNIQIEKVKGGFVVNYQNGQRNGKLTDGTKTDSPVTIEDAKEIFDALVKIKKDYTTDPSGIKSKKLKIK